MIEFASPYMQTPVFEPTIFIEGMSVFSEDVMQINHLLLAHFYGDSINPPKRNSDERLVK